MIETDTIRYDNRKKKKNERGWGLFIR